MVDGDEKKDKLIDVSVQDVFFVMVRLRTRLANGNWLKHENLLELQ